MNNRIQNEKDERTYGYRFAVGPSNPPCQIYSLGHQEQVDDNYYFYGNGRPDEHGNCIFQYTLSGCGTYELNGVTYKVPKGSAFIASIPSNHTYYLSKEDSSWEFLFLTLTGEYTLELWNRICKEYGPILTLDENQMVIKYIWELYSLTKQDMITTGYEGSTYGYEFLMKLQQSIQGDEITSSTTPYIDASIEYMKDNIGTAISLDNIADAVGLSKYHLNHSFKKAMGISPWSYLTKLRINLSLELLYHTTNSIEEIACQCGYSNANYFNKVFRKYLNISPGRLRNDVAARDRIKYII